MKTLLYKLAGVVVVLVSFALFVPQGHAATLFLSAKSEVVAVGSQVRVDVKIDGADQSFNAAQATVRFPSDILEVVSVDKTTSLFDFWLQGPTFSNTNGTVSFIGGSTTGFTGKSLQALGIVFRVKGTGVANISLSDGAITVSDGSGANILTTMTGIQLSVSVTQTAGPLVEIPTQIIRTPTPAVALPAKPNVSISLYEDSAQWYNVSAPFYASWDLPADVTDVASVVNRNPNFSPTVSKGLFISERFVAPDDGVSYVHVRFKNAKGWGPVAHYRINIDTVPPVAFAISLTEGASAQYPHRIHFKTSDALSGVDHYEITVNNIAISTSTGRDLTSYDLPFHLPPGKSMVAVRASDGAGNSTEDSLSVDIAPIASPTVALVSDIIYLGEGGLALTGTSLPNTTISLAIKDPANGTEVYKDSVVADADGKWSATFDQPLKKGRYFVEAVARNARGEMSYPVNSDAFSVKERPIITLWGVGITATWFWAGLVFLMLCGFGAGWATNRFWRIGLGKRTVIAERDVVISADLLRKDLKKLQAYNLERLTPSDVAEVAYIFKHIAKNIENMERYVAKNVHDIPR